MSRSTSRSTTGASALLTLSLALAAGAAPLGAQDQQRVEVTTRRTTRPDADSAVRRLKLRVDSLARAYNDNEELSVGERQRVGEELDRTVDALDRALAAAAGRSGTMFRVQMAPMADARAAEVMTRTLRTGAMEGPRGWLGIVVNGVAREPRMEGGELIVHYLSYPEIVSVEPSSPAQRAGLTPGDTLYAYDGRDVKDVDISMTRLLKPNAHVLVRTGANGRVRDVPVTIADAPSRIVLRANELNAPGGAIAGTSTFPFVIGERRQPMGRSMVTVTAPPVPTMPGVPAPASVGGLAGAQMGSLTKEWARLTGVAHGVIVLRVPVGSLAGESGLQDADVIVKAAGQAVSTLPELRNLLAVAWGSGEHALAIEYVRERKVHRGTLRW